MNTRVTQQGADAENSLAFFFLPPQIVILQSWQLHKVFLKKKNHKAEGKIIKDHYRYLYLLHCISLSAAAAVEHAYSEKKNCDSCLWAKLISALERHLCTCKHNKDILNPKSSQCNSKVTTMLSTREQDKGLIDFR